MQPAGNNMVGKVIGDYVIDRFFAQGGFGLIHVCFQVRDKDKKPFIVKIISKKSGVLTGEHSAYFQGLLDTEIELMGKFNHPNLIHLVDHLESSNYVYLILPFCADGDMTAFMGRKGPGWYFPEGEAVYYLKQISAGFSELFTRGIMHRDFKLENVFMDNGKCMIGDFGAAKELKNADAKRRTFIGGYTYSAPEVLKGELDPYGNEYDSKCDIWSIGIAYWYLLYGVQPFQGGDISILEKLELESGENLKFPNKPKISDSSKNLLMKMLQFDPKERINWQDLFEHEIFTEETFGDDILESGIQFGVESQIKLKDTKSDITANMFLNVQEMFEKG
jgi:serine/threonine protein kinase